MLNNVGGLNKLPDIIFIKLYQNEIYIIFICFMCTH